MRLPIADTTGGVSWLRRFCFRWALLLSSLTAALSLYGVLAHAAPPMMLFQGAARHDVGAAGGARASLSILRLPDGSFAFYNRNAPAQGPVELPDAQGKLHALLPHLPKALLRHETLRDSGVLDNGQVVAGPDLRLTSVLVINENLDKDTAAKVGLPRYLNVWVRQANPQQAEEPRKIWQGYNGSQMEYQRLSDGRLLVPHGSFLPHGRPVPPTGRHRTIVHYSDDGGATWQTSASELSSPCYAGFNGSNEGACEPAIEQLADGRIWMLMRTQAGFLYESFSTDRGATWSPARASRFSTSTGPPNIMRHRNGWLVVTWNNCELPPRHEGEGVYGGRDALHIAVSADEGRTWRGFREIYLDHRRNDNPAKSGDRGTAYPLGAYDAQGRIVIIAGQGAGGRNPIVIDPDWVVATEASTDFSDGLDQWSVYKHYGPAKRWWRARAIGCELIADPNRAASGDRYLHVRKPDELPADGATWNFPNGWKGSLTARVLIRDGSQGGTLCLNDRMFDPVNDQGEELSIFRVALEGDGRIGEVQVEREKWIDVRLEWDLGKQVCQLSVDGRPAGQLPLRHPTLNGISYLRLRSAAREPDSAGFLVRRVDVSIEDPTAPACSAEEQAAHERRYIERVVPTWSR
ncbi:MAG: exo-alpha-sialidase [Planctomycetales bacterium]|nr:exo-alpha-sialidase [Planctomycetales bacterium]